MRVLIPAVLLVLATPLGAQSSAIRPAPSSLFRASGPLWTPGDTTKYQGPSAVEGALIGGLGGFMVGFGLAKIVESQDPCACEDPGLDRGVTYALSGLVIGAFVGALLAGEK